MSQLKFRVCSLAFGILLARQILSLSLGRLYVKENMIKGHISCMWVRETEEAGLYRGKNEGSPEKNTKMSVSERMLGNLYSVPVSGNSSLCFKIFKLFFFC